MRVPAGLTSLTVALLMLLAGSAQAAFVATAAGTANVGSRTLQNASGLTPTCGQGSVKGVVLTWTASSDAFATGYTVFRQINNTGAFLFLATVSGGTSTTYNDATAKNANNGDVYAYTVSASAQSWATPQSAPVSKSFSPTNGKCLGP